MLQATCPGLGRALRVLSWAAWLLGAAAPGAAQTSQSSALSNYFEVGFLVSFQQVCLPDFPRSIWPSLALPPSPDSSAVARALISGVQACAVDGLPGLQGVACDNGTITELDLSHASLPTGTPRLNGSLASSAAAPAVVMLPNLALLNLAGNNLTGTLPVELSYAPALRRLLLAGNALSGPIPTELCSLRLDCLSLANNNLSGAIPPCFRSFPCLDFANNTFTRTDSDCNGSVPVSSCEVISLRQFAPPPPPSQSGGGLPAGAVVGVALGVVLLCALGLTGLVLFRRRRRQQWLDEKRRALVADVEDKISSKHFGALRRFTREELAHACNNFDPDGIVGEGGFSVVYKGRLEEGLEVAIKSIRETKMQANCELQFLDEVEAMSRVRHRNLGQCLGYCCQPGECLVIVLHYYGNGSLAARTYGKQGDPLSWPQRCRIAKGAADGLAYLHHDCSPALIHRDIKPENVLLTDLDEAVITDFGIAAEVDGEGQRGSQVKGTIGHIAPEYILNGRCTEKTDVYAYGILLLELITGKSVQELELLAGPDEFVQEWVQSCLEDADRVQELLDPDMGETSSLGGHSDVKSVLELALQCAAIEPTERPDISQVAERLVMGTSWRDFHEAETDHTRSRLDESLSLDALLAEMESAVDNLQQDSSTFGPSTGGSSRFWTSGQDSSGT